MLPCTKLKSKWIKDLNTKPDTLDLKEEKFGKGVKLIGTEKVFLKRTPVAQALRATINQWNLMKLKSSCKAKVTINTSKKQRID